MPGPMAMEKPPMPPDVAGQMGGGGAPFADVGGMMAQKQQAGNPIVSAVQAVEKVLTNVAKQSPKMGPYVQRAMAILKAGMEEATGAKEGGKPEGDAPQGPPPGQMPG